MTGTGLPACDRRARAGCTARCEQYANNVVEADHARLKARLPPMRGVKTLRSLRTAAAGHAFMQNLRHGHYEITVEDLARCL